MRSHSPSQSNLAQIFISLQDKSYSIMEMKTTFSIILILQLTLGAEGRDIDPPVQLEPYFPPAKPSLENLNAVCVHGNGRPRYPASCLPSSGYGYIRRAGTAINRVEAWFSQCCQRGVVQGDQQILCCIKQAWETALPHFCTEEYTTKTLVHECCEKKGEDRWNCFDKQAPNPSYQPLSGYAAPIIPPDRIFTWDPNTC